MQYFADLVTNIVQNVSFPQLGVLGQGDLVYGKNHPLFKIATTTTKIESSTAS
jgi:hypothetical protein